MRRKNIYYPFMAFLLCLMGCDKTDLTPAYIIIDEKALINNMDVLRFNESADPQQNYDMNELEALKSQRFPALWVSIDNGGSKEDIRGVWELPCKIPILASGVITVRFTPAYYKNGMSKILPGYKMVSTLEKTVTVERGGEIRFTKDDLLFTYNPKVFFPLLETFEQSTTFTRREEKIGADITIYNDGGRNVGLIELNKECPNFDIITQNVPLTYRGENNTLLELEYKMEYSGTPLPQALEGLLGVEILYKDISGQIVLKTLANFHYHKEWTTVYVDLATAVDEGSYGGTLSDLKIGLAAVMPENAGFSSIKFFFDNIKITTY